MVLILAVENVDQLPDGGPLSVRVERHGIDIGRNAYLDWTLPDDTLHISGRHCEVRYEESRYLLYDVSRNGTFVNGAEHRVQSPYVLRDGDEIEIGGYVISVRIEGAESGTGRSREGAADDSFYGFSGEEQKDVGGDLWAVDPAGAGPPLSKADLKPRSASRPVEADFLEWAIESPAPVAAAPAAGGSPGGTDFGWKSEPSPPSSDIWTDSPAPPAAAEPAEWPSEPPPPPPATGGGSEDWPLEPPAPPAPGGGSGDWPIEPPAAASANPDAAAPLTHRDPQKGADPAAMPAAGSPAAAAGAEPDVDRGGARAGGGHPQEPSAHAVASSTPAPESVAGPPSGEGAPSQPSGAPAATGSADAAILQGIAEITGLSAAEFEDLPPEEIGRMIGHFMVLTLENLKDLLDARASAKTLARSTRRTMVQAVDNNPVKFLPTAADALKVAFAAKSNGYLPYDKALKASFKDLKEHQVETYAAMRFALARLTEELSPDTIEKESSEAGGLLRSKEAALWRDFVGKWRAMEGSEDGGMNERFMLYFAEFYDRRR